MTMHRTAFGDSKPQLCTNRQVPSRSGGIALCPISPPRMRGACLLLTAFLLGAPAVATAEDAAGAGPAESMDKMWGEQSAEGGDVNSRSLGLFRDGNYAMFIHWGLYSNYAGRWNDKTYYGIGEWIMNRNMAGIPAAEYQASAKSFNPVDFDARAIAGLAKDAGMKYIVITSKHHDGFAMFDSEHPFNIVDATPFGRDPMKELAEACREAGLGFGFYYSHNQDWTSPGGSGGPGKNPDGSRASFDQYFKEKCYPQVKEICTNYGPLAIVWFDTPGKMPKEHVVALRDLVRETQPGALLCSRIGHGMGDYVSHGDMEVPPENIEGLWETVDTTNDSWSYAWYDSNWKGPSEILHRLVSTVARGGSYMLNVGPDGTGVVPAPCQTFLRQAGDWVRRHPEVVYSAGPSPWGRALPWGDVTTAGEDTLQLVVFDWPRDSKLHLPGLQSPIKSAVLLDGEKEVTLEVERNEGWTTLLLPCKAPDPLASVIKVRFDETPVVKPVRGVHPNFTSTLDAHFAEASGANKERLRWMEKFGEWKHQTQVGPWTENGKATWDIDVKEPGFYRVGLCYRGDGRLVWKISTDEGETVQNQQAATEKYAMNPMGVLEFKTPGRHTISVALVDGDRETASFARLELQPEG
ncbi:Alpha-L-fucosidase [Pirellulimonas nuda]|uniref:alpha-L-fucosidase n=1 Tax=Pirellulimonas nuda TaxID=2528009 RepID=A0A518DBK8_9BACT|nr:alpha-L-fucosidase [Pirellulimonas nuda]QDU88867.1 Alpha-L-fucosidase [Pirellulimonas nuda]